MVRRPNLDRLQQRPPDPQPPEACRLPVRRGIAKDRNAGIQPRGRPFQTLAPHAGAGRGLHRKETPEFFDHPVGPRWRSARRRRPTTVPSEPALSSCLPASAEEVVAPEPESHRSTHVFWHSWGHLSSCSASTLAGGGSRRFRSLFVLRGALFRGIDIGVGRIHQPTSDQDPNSEQDQYRHWGTSFFRKLPAPGVRCAESILHRFGGVCP